jgi:predicted MFS family arabinose efflux permease
VAPFFLVGLSAITLGVITMAGGFAMLSTVSAQTPYISLAAGLTMIVIGMSLTAAPATTAILTALPVEKAGIGSAVNDTTREVGTALGIAAAAAFADAFSLANSISVAVVLTTAAAVALHRRNRHPSTLRRPGAGASSELVAAVS